MTTEERIKTSYNTQSSSLDFHSNLEVFSYLQPVVLEYNPLIKVSVVINDKPESDSKGALQNMR